MKFAVLTLSAMLCFSVCAADFMEDMKCFNKESSTCIQEILLKIITGGGAITEDFDYCGILVPVISCIKKASSKCNINLDFDAMEKTYTKACQKGSDLNQRIVKNSPCIMQSSDSLQTCVKDFPGVGVDSTKLTDKEIMAISKQQCIKLDDLPSCVYKVIEEKCSADASAVAKELISPFMFTFGPFCDEIKKNSASSITISTWSIMFFILVSVFMLRRH